MQSETEAQVCSERAANAKRLQRKASRETWLDRRPGKFFWRSRDFLVSAFFGAFERVAAVTAENLLLWPCPWSMSLLHSVPHVARDCAARQRGALHDGSDLLAHQRLC